MKSLLKNPLFLDPLLALVLVHVVMFPFVRYIEGSGAFSTADLYTYALKPLFLYLSFVAVVTGLVGGYFRRKSMKIEEALRALLQERENLLRVLAHDLTSSVGSSRSLVSLINEDGLAQASPDDRESLQSVENSLDNAMSLIGLTRELLALESGKMELQVCPTSLEDLLKECVRLQQVACRTKGVTLMLDVEPGCRDALVEPVSLTNCVLGNLVGNAVKFSRPGGVVRLGLKQSGNCLRVEVVNLGPPVSEAKAGNLFNFTARTSTPGTSGERGTGFGLPLARRFAKLMGGDVQFSQDPAGEGLANIRFSVIVPAAAAHAKCRLGPAALAGLGRREVAEAA